ncbi:Protein flightless-1, partial [Fragariocoptes setiger]
MSPTGVLPFLRGADLSTNDFHEDNFPKCVKHMKGLKWLRLCKSKLDWIPEEFGPLNKLETLDLAHNNLVSLHGELVCLSRLRHLKCRHNKLNDSGIPSDLFNLNSLLVLNLSHNQLTDAPTDIERCSQLLVLNLGHNEIQTIRDQIFVHLVGLLHLDLSNNLLKTVPPQLGRLTNLQTLVLSNNPLGEHQMRQIERLKSLRELRISNTQRTVQNMPRNLGTISTLVELDLSSNQLHRIPEDLADLKNLRRINLSENCISKLPDEIGDWWPKLESLNLSSNRLTKLPSSICKMCNLRRLYLNDNQLDFEGLPSNIGKLKQLEVLMAASNRLELIPEGVFRCGRLKKLILTNNRLITLPDTIHLLYDLDTLELSGNPDLIMPPKHVSESSKNIEYYNIDFSLNTQLRLSGDPNSLPLPPQPAISRDPLARKLRLRRRAHDDVDQETNQAKVLKGMSDLAKEKETLANHQTDFLDGDLKPKRWDENLEKPELDYSEFFEPTTGQLQGLTVWEIENFRPVMVDSNLHGKFYDADCYIILNTTVDENTSLHWSIYYWIGNEAALDKKACSAIHAVNLRNFLNAQCRTVREEQGEESDEFIAMFPDGIDYVKGARTSSGFYAVEEVEYAHRMYRLHEMPEKTRQLHMESVALTSDSLDSRLVFLIDCGYKIYVWNGLDAKNTTKQKARLLGEKLNKDERKNKAEIIFCDQGDEPSDLLSELGLTDILPKVKFKTQDFPGDFEIEDFKPKKPIMYQVSLGIGFIELPQVHFKQGKLLPSYLQSTNVYILDCFTDIFVWMGRKSPKLVRNAALNLAQEAFDMIKRPDFACISSCLQGTESQFFKSKFKDWDDVIAVDYTRTAESVSRTGADLSKWMNQQKIKIDLASLFAPRQIGLSDEESQLLIEDWNDELDMMKSYVLEKGKRFAELPQDEFGHFYSGDCYVFLCRYFVPEEDVDESSDSQATDKLPNGLPLVNGTSIKTTNNNSEDDMKCVVYFWQGRDASNMGWLTFTFSLQKKFESFFGNKLEVIKMQQQQENMKFLSHFRQKFVIHQGKRNSKINRPELYQIRSNNNPLTFRCIQIETDSANLNSGFCHLLRVPYEYSSRTEQHLQDLTDGFVNGQAESNGNVVVKKPNTNINHSNLYVWIGSKCRKIDSELSIDIARSRFIVSDDASTKLNIITEGEEPVEFWAPLNGKKEYTSDASFMNYTRLFRCSNDKGYFSVSEKCSDFCQDDLSDDDIMILDNGEQVFLWVGSRCSEVEIKLAYKSAQVYVQNMRIRQPDRPRQLMLTFKGKETRKFTKCFHSWTHHRTIKDPRGDERKFLVQNAEQDARLKEEQEKLQQQQQQPQPILEQIDNEDVTIVHKKPCVLSCEIEG